MRRKASRNGWKNQLQSTTTTTTTTTNLHCHKECKECNIEIAARTYVRMLEIENGEREEEFEVSEVAPLQPLSR